MKIMADELNRPEIKNFIEAFVEEDISEGGQFAGMQVHTRFPPEPHGIGIHATFSPKLFGQCI